MRDCKEGLAVAIFTRWLFPGKMANPQAVASDQLHTGCVYRVMETNFNIREERIEQMRNLERSRSVRGALCAFAVLAFVGCATLQAAAQWSAGTAEEAWTGYQNAYLYLESDGYSRVFVTEQGSTTPEDLWRQAEEIEVAEDAYNQNKITANKNIVESLCDGFVYLNGDTWTSDNYNDDVDVAIIAMSRAYYITGTARWLNDAKSNYATVWGRAQAGDGGLCQNVTLGCYGNSSVNLTFVWAAAILNSIDPNGTGYNSQGTSVYNWAVANLYNSSTGEIYDAKGGVHGQYTYNYGYAMIAAGYHGGSAVIANISNYVFNDLTNYNGTTDGYNIMPNYGQGNVNDGGFNGILMRGVGFANALGYLPSADLAAAQANINKAWAERNGIALSWNNWDAGTPGDTGNYSWDDSPTLAGMLDLPPTT